MTAKPDKFVWPPKPLPPADLVAPAEPLGKGAVHLLTNSDDFFHPLEEPADELCGEFESVERAPTPSSRGIRRWIEALEVHYFGRTAAPWDVRAAAANWHADQSGDYCPRCGVTVRPFELDTLNDPATCVHCRDKRPSWDRFIRLGVYRGVLARSIREFKFSRFRALGERLGELLGESINAELESRKIDRSRVVLVPVPMTPWRRLSRGIDHTLVITRAASHICEAPIARLLVRRHRPSQLEVPPSQRRRNVAGAFFCRRGVLKIAPGTTLIVVDDVRTTGATMMEACRTLKSGLSERKTANPDKARTEVWGATVGVVPRPEEENRAEVRQEIGSASRSQI